MAKPTVDEIRKLKTEFIDYKDRLTTLQNAEQEYYDDKFPVSSIKAPFHIKRTGAAARIVDGITQHISTSNPQVFREPHGKSATAAEKSQKVARLLNSWVTNLTNEIEDAGKDSGLRGEGFFQIEYSDDKEFPLKVTVPDPLTVFPDPHESKGIPVRVIKSYKATVGAIQNEYPNWRPRGNQESTEEVEYLAYWDKDWRYMEADEVSIIDIQPNVLGVVSFVHFYSGFGKTSPSAKPEEKAVGRLRKLKDLLLQECEQESRKDSIFAIYANPVVIINPVEGYDTEPPDATELKFSPGAVITGVRGWVATIFQGIAPTPEMFHDLVRLRARIGDEVPPVSLGVSSGAAASGRKEDILGYHFGRRYIKLVKNLEQAIERMLGLALKICENVPGVLPLSIQTVQSIDGKDQRKEEAVGKEDIDKYYGCKVELRPEDEREKAGRLMEGRMMLNDGRISWLTFLTKYAGLTEDKAKREIYRTIAEKITMENPMMLDAFARMAFEQSGGGAFLREYDARMTAQGQPQQPPITSSQPGRNFNTQTPLDRDVIDQELNQSMAGQRRAPSE